MHYQDMLDHLKHLSLFDLTRLQVAIKHELDNPDKTAHIRARLHVGMRIDYFAYNLNSVVSGVIRELHPKNVITQQDGDPHTQWKIPYYVICIDVSPVQNKASHQHLSKATTFVHMAVGFEHRGVLYFGKIIQRNPKKAKIVLDNAHTIWNVPYSLLFQVIEGESSTIEKPILIA
jgi:hypothetical protein